MNRLAAVVFVVLLVFAFVPATLAQDTIIQYVNPLFGAQLVFGEGWQDRIVLRNLTSIDQYLRLFFFTPKGETLHLKVGDKEASLPAYFPIVVKPGEEKSVLLTRDSAERVTGWLWVDQLLLYVDRPEDSRAAPEIEGELVRELVEGGKAVASYSTRLEAASSDKVIEDVTFIPEGARTGLAIANVSSLLDARVTLQALNEYGGLVAETRRFLPPLSQEAKFVDEYFADDPDWEIYLRVVGGDKFRGSIRVIVTSALTRGVAVAAINF